MLGLAAVAVPLRAQEGGAASAADVRRLGAMAIALGSSARPGVGGRVVTEGYLTQPMLLADGIARGGRLAWAATLNLEGVTLRRGEINPGSYGEGFIDRRHPHTLLHEAMAGLQGRLGVARASLFAGKGVVPFGSDDPMVRPFVKYPVNHHLAQVMERAQVVVALAAGRGTLEAARFNGDEPEGPSDWPTRGLDSWTVRGSLTVAPGVEVAASDARVRSPEFATGEGLDHRKRSAAVRLARADGRVRHALLEWGRTLEGTPARPAAFRYTTWLAEGALALGGATAALRVERTERPEEDRLADPYRSVRPLLDFNVLGRTRWDVATVHVAAAPRRWGAARLAPFLEGAWLRPRALATPAAIEPRRWFGASTLWLWSAGVRMHAGPMRPRFGRYGVAAPGPRPAHDHGAH